MTKQRARLNETSDVRAEKDALLGTYISISLWFFFLTSKLPAILFTYLLNIDQQHSWISFFDMMRVYEVHFAILLVKVKVRHDFFSNKSFFQFPIFFLQNITFLVSSPGCSVLAYSLNAFDVPSEIHSQS